MECKMVKKEFKAVGIKNRGAFNNFGSEVPVFAQQFLKRTNEIQNSSGTEIAFFEPKRGENHLEGNYYVGVIVVDKEKEVPSGMEYIETTQHYMKTRGKISDVDNLHRHLLKWADEKGFERDLESYIVETYHPNQDEEEEVEVYLPINF